MSIPVVLLATPLVGCVIPPSLSVENQDAGTNSPPAILAVRSDQQELPEGETVLFDVGEGTLSVELLDTDLLDTLHVRFFVDYTLMSPLPPRVLCTAPSSGAAKRTVQCDLTGLCVQGDVGPMHLLSIKVFDRLPLESGTPLHQAVPEGGLSTGTFFQLRCQDPQ